MTGASEGVVVILRFADCELDLGRVFLRRDGAEVPMEPQVFDVLAVLVQHRGRVVRKEELLDEVWGDRFVSESALSSRIKAVRRAVGDDGTRQAVIRTVHGKGYEFVADVAVVEDADAARPEEAGTHPPAARLPAPVQPLIGREVLLTVLERELAAHRLVTLVGPGGVGKTSVAYELARRVGGRYPDGVLVVALDSVVDEHATAAAFATAIDVNVRLRASVEDAIIDTLRPRRCLMVLDNCEHLIDPVAELVSRILRDAPAVSILTTSRERLAVPGEQVWAVDPLSTSGADVSPGDWTAVPAVALFAERAGAGGPAFRLDGRTAPIVLDICRRLDGIPLAIELAAARAGAIDVVEIARRLDERFSLLKAMRRGSDPRHRTLDDAISWSYDLLTPEERALFTTLSVFAGSFDLASAEALCPGGDALDLLARLSERSMLQVRHQAEGGTRYELLETLREYGRTRLGDDEQVARFTSHASHFASFARAVEADLQTPEEPGAVARADGSFADLRAAQRFALEVGDLDTAFALIGSIREFAMRAMRYETFAWADAACQAPGGRDHPLVPLLTGIRAYGAWVRGEFDLAIALAEETRELESALGAAPSGLAERALVNVLGVIDRGDRALLEARRQVEVAEASGDLSRLVHAGYMGAVAMSGFGHYEEAADLINRARVASQRTQSPTDLASVAVADGFVTRGSDESALAAFRTADRLARSAGNRWMSAFARTEISGLLVHRGAVEEGCAMLADMVDLWSRTGDWSQQWHTLSRCMIALHRIDQAELAAEVLGAIETHAILGVAPMSTTLRKVALATREMLDEELGHDRCSELRELGGNRPVGESVQRIRAALLARSVND